MYGLHKLSQLTKITLDCSLGQQLDFRKLRDLENCRRLGLFYVEQISPSTSPLPCLNELTQVTSLLLHGADCLTNDVWQLTGLQNLQILTCSSQQTYWEQLTALTILYAPVQALRHGLEHLSLLKRLCISAWTLDHIEDILPALHGRTSLTLLCLKYPEAPQEEASFNLGALQGLSRLQELWLEHSSPSLPLSLQALARFSYKTCCTVMMPVLSRCPRLRSVELHISHTQCLVAPVCLPAFGPSQPLHIRHILRGHGRLLLDFRLLVYGHLPEGLQSLSIQMRCT